MHNEITIIDHAFTRPWTVDKHYIRDRKVMWFEDNCTENNHHIVIGTKLFHQRRRLFDAGPQEPGPARTCATSSRPASESGRGMMRGAVCHRPRALEASCVPSSAAVCEPAGCDATAERSVSLDAAHRRRVVAFASVLTVACLVLPSATAAVQQHTGQLAVPASPAHPENVEELTKARQKYEDEAAAYWALISQMRRGRNAKRRDHQDISLNDYVLAQPPAYVGGSRSIELSLPPEKPPPMAPKYVPVVADFLKSARIISALCRSAPSVKPTSGAPTRKRPPRPD